MLDATELIEFQIALRDRALIWFIKWSTLHQNPTLDEVKQ